MSRHLERLLQIDALLRTGQRQTAVSLAKDLEVSERTVRSDLAFLRDRFSAPLEFNCQKGHHYTDTNWCLPTISLSKGELFALTLEAKILDAYSASGYASELRSAIGRLSERSPEQTWVNLQQLAHERVVFRAEAELDLDPEIWHQLEVARQTSKRVKIAYYTAGRNTHSKRLLDPYILHISRSNP